MPKTHIHHNYKNVTAASDKVLRPTYNPVLAVCIGEIRLCISTPGDADMTVRAVLFPSNHPPPILTPPPSLASCTRAFITTVFKGSVCSSTALHTRSSLICINGLLKNSDPISHLPPPRSQHLSVHLALHIWPNKPSCAPLFSKRCRFALPPHNSEG